MREVDAPVLLLLVSRPPLPAETLLSEALANVQTIVPLQPLSDVESRELLDHVLGDHRLSSDFLDRMVDCADGNPLFLEEITKSMLDREIIVREDGFLVATQSSEDLHVPDSIESLLSSRLDGLDAEAKRVLQYAAIVGRRFWSGVVADALAGRPVDKELDQLRSGALVRSQEKSAIDGEEEFVFEHLMMQEVAYQGLLRGLRTELHGAVAEWLDKNVGSAEYADWIAYHFERSTQPELALPYLEEAAERAMQQGALMDAHALLDRALATDPPLADQVRLLGLRESVETSRGDVAGRLATIEELEGLAGQHADRAMEADAAYRRSRLQLDTGDLGPARENAALAIEGFADIGDGSREADTHRVLGRIEHQWGRYPEAIEHYEASLELERAAGDRFGEAETLDRLGLVEVDTGRFVAGLERFAVAAAISRELNNAALEARVLSHEATARRWLGDLDGAERMSTEAGELARRCGSRRALASADFTHGLILAAAGRTEEALPLIREAVDAAQSLARRGLESRARLELACLESGDAALASGTAAIEAARETGLVHIEILALNRLAELALEANRLGEADRHSSTAVQMLRRHGNIQGPEEAVYYTRARVLETLGREEEAERPLSEARAALQLKAVWISDAEDRARFLALGPNPTIMGLS
jgi:tetratricopeptide (TPR) repeat protein